MKISPLMVIFTGLLLVGCTSSSRSGERPFNAFNWSVLWPGNWFASSLTVTEQGVGNLNGTTPMTRQAITEALGRQYRLRQGMRREKGDIVDFWQVLKAEKISMLITGDSLHRVQRIEVLSPQISDKNGIRIGSPFSALFSRAFGHCLHEPAAEVPSLVCIAPGSQHIRYLFQGPWRGPVSLMPPDSLLQRWTVRKIIWQR